MTLYNILNVILIGIPVLLTVICYYKAIKYKLKNDDRYKLMFIFGSFGLIWLIIRFIIIPFLYFGKLVFV